MKSLDATGMGGCQKQKLRNEKNTLTGFLQLEQNSKLHVGHRTERGSNIVAFDDDDGC